jgi:hypothetical protein
VDGRVILSALLSRLLRRGRARSGGDARRRLMDVIRSDRAAHTAHAAAPPPPPTPEELIEDGTLKIIPGEVEQALPRPAPASFHLPAAGWRLAGLAYDPQRTLYAMVQLLPGDVFWLDVARFPPGEWRTVRMAGEPTRVQRMGSDLCVEAPGQGGEPGQWLPLKL